MTGGVKILKAGFFTTIQDGGRFGFSKYGVPRSGAMDKLSYGLANLLLGNDKNSACIEWTFQPPVLHFFENTEIVLTGAEADAFLNDLKIDMYKKIRIVKDDILKFKSCRKGVYGYVGIRKGFSTSLILKSRSFYKSITSDYRLENDAVLPYEMSNIFDRQLSTISIPILFDSTQKLEVYKGPEFDHLSKDQQSFLFDNSFTISNTINRMAIQLEEKLYNDLPSMLTSPVLPGTVQLTPSGTLIILMRDCQTTGGYPRVLQLSEMSINSIAQKRMKERCSFKLI
ncbi:biotin-dependent carboxyltransferase family protein [Aquimarina algiphila]|uniref:Biotin-dependent carboxyltransferase family protein n=1 Tax=Aquimarina algiphila TaxID=2047982 RepID=A0A554VMV1_9FLAO|nr:biotin-dependent carboxyltransferase family protein [Aquimarina algiphila]TSE09626.1 biotin-dependent carboxyltransferase family protein [Aquimarina algiphila]